MLISDDILVDVIDTDLFESFKLRDYPGIGIPTRLSKSFSAQGISAPPRRYNTIRKLDNTE